MRPILTLSVILSVLGLALPATLHAAEHDPWQSLDPAANTALLADLNHDLGTALPTDPRLATAEMALVDLALNGDQRDRGAHGGIWRTRARELRDLRHQAGVTPATFHDAVPDLWVSALDGCSAVCLKGLDALKAADAKDPVDQIQSRALRCYATGDWRVLRSEICKPHERAALAAAYFRAGMPAGLDGLIEDVPASTFGDFMMDEALHQNDMNFNAEPAAKALRLALHAVSRLAVSPDLPPECAAAADQFAADVGIAKSATAAARAPAFVAAFSSGDAYLDHNATRDAWLLTTAVIAAAADAGTTGLRGADGAWHLAGPGDRAIAARLDLGMAMWLLAGAFWGDGSSNRSSGIRDADPDLYGPWYTYERSSWNDQAAATATMEGITREVQKGPAGVPPMRLMGLLERIATMREQPREFRPAIAALAKAQAAAEPGRGVGWATVGEQLYRTGQLDADPAGVIAAAAADTWSPELAILASKIGKPLPHTGNGLYTLVADDAVLAELSARMPWRLDILSKHAQSLCTAKRWADALPVTEAVLAADPDNEVAPPLKGDCLHGLGRNDEAIAVWSDFLARAHLSMPSEIQDKLAAACEQAGKMDDADRWFHEATKYGSEEAKAYAEFLMRRGRGREAAAVIDANMIPFTAFLHLEAARCLIESANATADDYDDAFVRIRDHQDQMLRQINGEDFKLCIAIRIKSLDQRFLDLSQDSWHEIESGVRSQVGIMLTVTGRAAAGAQWLSEDRASYRSRHLGKGWCLIWLTLAARLGKRPELAPAPDELRAELGVAPDWDPYLSYFTGDLDRATALAKVAQSDVPDLHLYLGLDAAAHGDRKQARDDLNTVITGIPTDVAAGDARCALAWLDGGKVAVPLLEKPATQAAAATPAASASKSAADF